MTAAPPERIEAALARVPPHLRAAYKLLIAQGKIDVFVDDNDRIKFMAAPHTKEVLK